MYTIELDQICRLYSAVLGRPTMANEGTFDVQLIPGTLHGDGSENPYFHYQQAFIGLIHVIDETVSKVGTVDLTSTARQ